MLVLLAGLALPALMRVRAMSDRTRSQEHLRRIAFAVFGGMPPDVGKTPGFAYPPATVVNPSLAADERLSWYVPLLPALGGQDPVLRRQDLLRQTDSSRAWDAGMNREAGLVLIPSLVCPTQMQSITPGEPAPTNYVGVAGLGTDAAKLPVTDPRAGVLRYDSPTPLSAVRDGISHTLLAGETAWEVWPWIRGGPGTARGLDPDRLPYIGAGAPFGGCFPGGGNFLYADGSARFLVEGISPAVFRASVTIAGGELDRQGSEE
jgi:prepilin-type processing-associated H-X9-DG protein